METGSPRGKRAAILAGAIAVGLLAVVIVDALGGDGGREDAALDGPRDTTPTVLGSVVEGTLPEAPPASPVVLDVDGDTVTTDAPAATATTFAPATTAPPSTDPELIPPTVIENTTTTSAPTTTSETTSTSESTTTTTEP